ncbi:MAG: 30S ribosomal protein S9 [Candidatus Omnitrophota bacterium]
MTEKLVAIGRRKEAVARVELVAGAGRIKVNNSPLDKYFKRETDVIYIKQPFVITNTMNKFDILAKVKGGGISGQAGALRLGIARALLLSDNALKQTLRRSGLLTRDSRTKERKKYGQKGARKRFQWTKR